MSQVNTNQDQVTEVRFSDVKNAGLGSLVSGLNMVHNTFRAGEHVTGILADKAENYRKQIAISDAIEHNDLMLKYTEQAKKAGLDLNDFDI